MKSQTAFISWEYDIEEDAYIIAHFFVPVDERGQGKGRKMLQEAIAEMREEGKAKKIMLAANSAEEDPRDPIDLFDLVEFYESEGFDIIPGCEECASVPMELFI
ncbi:GNAT family N-acetyltransferase [Vibrio harveyi]|uniref:GNAT family N-acetyltransferase n=1 Tax=Vibrio harveyi TaxID=669 RepID=UPI003CE7D245